MQTTNPTEPTTRPQDREPDAPVEAGWRATIARWVGSMPRPQPVLLFWFGLAILIVGHPSTMLPESKLDNSWSLGINLAAARHLRFGQDILFNFGPWG
jgi:hypothetical protein